MVFLKTVARLSWLFRLFVSFFLLLLLLLFCFLFACLFSTFPDVQCVFSFMDALRERRLGSNWQNSTSTSNEKAVPGNALKLPLILNRLSFIVVWEHSLFCFAVRGDTQLAAARILCPRTQQRKRDRLALYFTKALNIHHAWSCLCTPKRLQ